jgi:hypothetical protein
MTIKDVTKSILIPVTLVHSDERNMQFYTAFSLDGFAWNVGKEGSWLTRGPVDKDFNLSIELTAGE